MKRILWFVLILIVIALFVSGCTINVDSEGLESLINDYNNLAGNISATQTDESALFNISESGMYGSKEEVALYIYTYGKLPQNYVTKEAAKLLGWSDGALDDIVPNMCIGGDRFDNADELLPTKVGREYFVCDVNTLESHSRGYERIVFSNDGLVFYSCDNCESFVRVYPETIED